MKSRARRLLVVTLMLTISVFLFLFWKEDTKAVNNGTIRSTLNAGAALIIDANITMEEKQLESYVKSINVTASNEEELITTGLVMANVKNVLNVRENPEDGSKKVGKLYSDCGGTILERKDGWTKIESGNVLGWCKDEYLFYGEEAEELAEDVGIVMMTSTINGLRVRSQADLAGSTLGVLNKEDVLEIISDYENEDEWVTVDYEGVTAYVSAEFIEINRIFDVGETIDEYEARIAVEQAEEKAARRAANKDIDSYISHLTDKELLAALIYCEAGNQSDEGKLAVGAVVINRVNCSAYPDTIRGVIGASGQFSPVASGFLRKVVNANKVPQSCYDAAEKAMNGETPVGGAMHFRRAGKREGTVIGDHVFW